MTKEEKLQEAKRLYKTANADQRYVLECLFPELAESEDEEIRQAMINFFKSERIKDGIAVLHFGVNIEKMIAWLEKQGEQKEYTFKPLPRLIDMIEPTSKAKAYCQKLIETLVKEGYSTDAKIVGECLKKMNGEKVAMATMDEKQAPKTKWSEEDSLMIDSIIETMKWLEGKGATNMKIDWLTSLKQRMGGEE